MELALELEPPLLLELALLAELDAASGGGGRRATLVTAPVWPFRVWIVLPVPSFHSLKVLSKLPERARVPSADRATLATVWVVWPSSL